MISAAGQPSHFITVWLSVDIPWSVYPHSRPSLPLYALRIHFPCEGRGDRVYVLHVGSAREAIEMGGVGREEAASRRQAISLAASRVRADIAFTVVDVVVVVAAYTIALGIRMLDPLVGDVQIFWRSFAIVLPVIITVHVVANAIAGAYGHVWEYASITEAVRLVVANAAATAMILLVAWVVRNPLAIVIPYTTLVLGGLLSLLLMGLVRYRSRLFSFRKVTVGSRILIVGSGPEAAAFARQAPGTESGGRIVGFLNGETAGGSTSRLLAGLPILGGVEKVAEIVRDEEIDQVVVIGSDPDRVRKVVDLCLEVDVRLRILPGVEDVMGDLGAPLDVRDLKVEDLLNRQPVSTDMSDVAQLISGEVVLVTGAGGSIGSEIVRQVLHHGPAAVWALDRDETLLHDASLHWSGNTNAVLADIRDAPAILRAFERIRPGVVFHAAALKHVPVLEEFPEEAVLTNIVGTQNVIEAGSRVGTKRFVLISTDKAVNPTSIMGATKRVAELLVKAGNERNDSCVYTAVRFGNVLGSRGSVIPTFVSQIRSGGPVTVTDPEMTRYFMTVNEAVQLVLQAAALAAASEVFLLDMGEPIKITDLARRLIRLAGLIPEVDINIEYTGRRPGEKLEETLTNGSLEATSNPKVFEVPLTHPGAQVLAKAVADLEDAALAGETRQAVSLLNALAEGSLKPMPHPLMSSSTS